MKKLHPLLQKLAAASISASIMFFLCAATPALRTSDIEELSQCSVLMEDCAPESVLQRQFISIESPLRASEDHRSWAQADPRWGSIRLGQSSYTVASSGCLVTSVTKLIIQSGYRSPDNFNVADLANWLNAHGGFSSTGGLYWAKPAQMIEGFEFEGAIYDAGYSSDGVYQQKLLDYAKQGYHIVLTVKNYGHYVAVDNAKSLAEGRVYIMDSLNDASVNADVELASRYSYVSRICLYSGMAPVVSTPPAAILGDADSDGSVTLGDALAVLRYAMHIPGHDDINLLVCDIDGDGSIDMGDALAIMRMGI